MKLLMLLKKFCKKTIFIFILILSYNINLHAQIKKDSTSKSSSTPSTNNAGTIPTYAINGEATLTSNYIERGLSYSNSSPALNTSLLMNFGSQFKLGFWGSNIAELDSTQDNFLVKYVGEVLVDLKPGMKFIFYIHDEHYYKSSLRNGQKFGSNIFIYRFNAIVEYMNNYEGTHDSAIYTQVKFDKSITIDYGLDLALGYTMSSSSTYKSYLDLYTAGYYKFTPKIRSDLGITLPSNTTQFGSRSHLQYFLKLNLQW